MGDGFGNQSHLNRQSNEQNIHPADPARATSKSRRSSGESSVAFLIFLRLPTPEREEPKALWLLNSNRSIAGALRADG